MSVKTYQAKTMADALADVKRELGRDAVILHTRSVRRGGLLGFGGRSMWEVTAAPNINVAPRGRYVAEAAAVDIAPPVDESLPAPALPEEPPPAREDHRNLRSPLASQINEIRSMVETLLSRKSDTHGDLPEPVRPLRDHLQNQEVEPAIVDEIIKDLRLSLTGQELCDGQTLRDRLCDMIASRIPTAPDAVSSAAKVIALVGPTGVGKTTTIAKLAANYKLQEGRRVGLITIDTYRIAAVDQLRTYAQIIDIPLKVVLTTTELRQAVSAMRDLDVILVDTAGRSQNDQLRLNQLRGFLQTMEAQEVHLVVSGTANRGCARKILDHFVPLGVNRLIVTKLDEAETFGMLLNVAAASGVPLSYVTLGQGVPDDIARADALKLSRMIMGGSAYVD